MLTDHRLCQAKMGGGDRSPNNLVGARLLEEHLDLYRVRAC